MNEHIQETAGRQLRYVTYLSIGANVVLISMKFIVGAIAGSLSLLADAIHSVSDMITDLAVIIGINLGEKKADQTHPYGHGKIETLAASLIAAGLLVVGLGMIYYAAVDITKGHIKQPSYMVLAVAVLAIAVKEAVYQITKVAAIKYHSPAVLANAWHDRADALSSIAVVIGVIVRRFGFNYGDQVAAIAVGIMVTFIALKIIGDCLGQLTERAVDRATAEQIEQIINSNPSIRQWHKLRTRVIGREVFLDLHILVSPDLNVTAAHGIAEGLENALHEQMARPINIVVHIEPDLPELRKQT
jgi:cation diffusion facilitator family transporter